MAKNKLNRRYIKDRLENMLFRPISKLDWYKENGSGVRAENFPPALTESLKTPQLVISLAFSAVLASLRSLRACWPCSKAIISSLKWCTLMLVMIRPFFTITMLMVATLLDFIIISSKQVKGNNHQQAFCSQVTCGPYLSSLKNGTIREPRFINVYSIYLPMAMALTSLV